MVCVRGYDAHENRWMVEGAAVSSRTPRRGLRPRLDDASLAAYIAELHDARHVLDEDMSPSGCAVADMNGDASIDLVCIGGRTANLKWYEDVSP